MTIKTYEIHNSYLQDAPDNAGITRMVSEADYLSHLQQTDALQTSLNNIINAFGISGEGAHSKLVIEYAHRLVAENAALKARTPFAYSYRYAGCETCEGFQNWRWELSKERPPEWMLETGKVTNLVELFECYEAPNTDAAIAEIKAQSVGEFAADMWKRGNELMAEGAQKSLVVQARLTAKLADTYVDNLRAGRKG